MDHKIWNLYPQQIIENINEIKIINTSLPPNQDLYDFTIVYLDKNNDLDEIYNFLKQNYTNQKNTFNIYSKNLLSWFFNLDNTPHLIGIRYKKTDELIAFICGIVRNLQFLEKKIKNTIEVNFLCVNNSKRKKYLTEILINQLWLHNKHKDAAIFYTNKTLPTSFSKIELYAYPINIDTLINANYFELPEFNKDEYISKLKNFYRCDNYDYNNLRNVELTDIKYIMNQLKIFYKNKLCFEITENTLQQIITNTDFFVFCSLDLQNFTILYITKQIKDNVELTIGNVYLFYQNTDQNSNLFKLEFIKRISDICDLLVFPKNFDTSEVGILIKHSVKYYESNIHLFQHSCVKITCKQNYLQIF